MDREQIALQASQMKSKTELCDLVTQFMKEEWKVQGYDISYFSSFTEKELAFYSNPRHTHHRYYKFKIEKKSGGFRRISVPYRGTFRVALSAINKILRLMYTPSKYTMGFVEGRSVVTNADLHKGQNYVFNIDLKDFFPSIHLNRIQKILQLHPFCFTPPIASLIAGLCTVREGRKDEDGHMRIVYVLPQGAPTSPVISNIICERLDFLLGAVAKRFGLNYSRYADDITFSSMHNVYQEYSEFRKELVRIIKDQGFSINESKTRLQKKGERQEVTGIIVSEKLNVTQKYVRDLRNFLYIWDRYGYSVAYIRFITKYKEEKGHAKKRRHDLINLMNVIEGKLCYLKMVKGEGDSVYQRLNTKFRKLAGKDRGNQNSNNKKVVYMETIRLLDFEKKNSTTVSFAISESGHHYAYFPINGKNRIASVKKYLTTENVLYKKELVISLCQRNGTTFWLIHR